MNFPTTAKVALNPKETYVIPYSYILANRSLGILKKMDSVSIPCLIYEHLQDSFEFKLKAKENADKKAPKEHLLNVTANLIDYELEHDEVKSYLAIDVSTFKCHPIGKITPPQILITFNPPLTVHNWVLKPMEIWRLKTDNKELELLAQLNPGECRALYEIKPNNFKETRTFYKLIQSDISYFVCHSWNRQIANLNDITEDPMTFALYENEKKVEPNKERQQVAFNAHTITRPYVAYNNNNYDNFELRNILKEICYGRKMIISARQAMVNKTDYCFKFGIQSVYKLTLKPHSNMLYNILSNNKLQFKIPKYQWSNPTNVSTVGLSGTFVLKSKGHKESQAEVLEFGIKISEAQYPFNLTTVVTIVPRYLFINQLENPIIISQFETSQNIILNPGKTPLAYQFQYVQKAENKKIIISQPQLPEGSTTETISTKQPSRWSKPFYIDNIDSFELQMPCEKTAVAKQSSEWHEPSEANNWMQCIRVTVSSSDEATLFVVFSTPNYHEFTICNNTDSEIKFNMKDIKTDKYFFFGKKLY